MLNREREQIFEENTSRQFRNGCVLALGGVFIMLTLYALVFYGLGQAALWFIKQVHDIFK